MPFTRFLRLFVLKRRYFVLKRLKIVLKKLLFFSCVAFLRLSIKETKPIYVTYAP